MARMKVKAVRELVVNETSITEIVERYNNFVDQWNKRESNTSYDLPSCHDEWSEIITIGGLGSRSVFFRFKNEHKDQSYVLVMKKGFSVFDRGLCRSKIKRSQIERVWVKYYIGHPKHPSTPRVRECDLAKKLF